jgi:hypothetical protein
MQRIILLALLISIACADFLHAETVIIRNDGGGNITEYRERRARLAKVNGEVRIEAKCLSACTIYTTLPNACVMPNAKIGFHGTTPKSGIPSVDYMLDMRMGEYYRGDVRKRFESKWRFLGGSDQFHVISGTRLTELDPKIRLCDGPPQGDKRPKRDPSKVLVNP